MKRYVLPLFIALLTLVIGATIALVWISYHPKTESFDKVDIAGLSTIPYCEIKQNSEKYSGKVVRIDANLNWFMHGYFLEDPRCSESVDKTYLDSGRTAVSLNAQQREQLFSFLKPFDVRNQRWAPGSIVTVGRFKYERPEGWSDMIQDRTPFHFEIFSIESASRDRQSDSQ